MKVRKPTELREKLFETLEQTSRGQVFLIQHKAGNSVLQDEGEYLDLLEQLETLKSINRGLQDYLDGKTLTHSEMKRHIQRHASKK